MNKINAYIQFTTLYTYICENFIKNPPEHKRMQVFPLKLQYQKVLSGFFKKKSAEAYEIQFMSNPMV